MSVHNLARIFLRNKLQARIINDSFKHPARVLQTMQSGSLAGIEPAPCDSGTALHFSKLFLVRSNKCI
jgi:hypothetical protein